MYRLLMLMRYETTIEDNLRCSETCGSGGLSRRSLHCIDTRNGNKVDARFCEGVPHEPVETECNRTPCPRWVYSQWYQLR
ncbi:hypothetical protein GPALN_003289 [Globodera pallida]|nr:hypothetical protein GPALN_003289 [Globodera pallida]